MASFSSTGWAPGAAVTVYVKPATPGAALGAAVTSGTADTNGAATFSGLADSTNYQATDGTVTRTFRTAAASTTSSSTTTKLPPVTRRSQPLTFRQDTRILDPSASTLGTLFIQPEQIVRDTNGDLYCATTFSHLNTTITAGWLKCPAGQDPRTGSNWTEVGAISGLPSSSVSATQVDAPCPFRLGTAWYVLVGPKATGSGISLYKSTTGLLGPYSLATANLIPVGGAGTWDVARVTEPAYVRRWDGTHAIAYMGFDTGNVHEQIGIATCPSASNIELAASWTKAAGNPIVPVGAAGSDDEQVVADPTLLEYNGIAHLLYCGGAGNAVAAAVVQPQMLATSTDWTTWTKRGPIFDRAGLWPADTAPSTLNGAGRIGPNWRGHFFPLGAEYDYDVLWPYGANYGSFSGNIRRVQARMAVIPIDVFRDLANLPPLATRKQWIRVQSDATDARVVKTGTWTSTSNAVHNGGIATFSNTAGDRIGWYFNGPAIRVAGQCRNNQGTYNVWIDGVKVASEIDAYQVGDTTNNYWSVYYVDKDDLSNGEHYVEIEVTGNKNAASIGAFVTLDFAEWLSASGA